MAFNGFFQPKVFQASMILWFHDGPDQGKPWPVEEGSSGSVNDMPMWLAQEWNQEYGTTLRATCYQELAEISKWDSFYQVFSK